MSSVFTHKTGAVIETISPKDQMFDRAYPQAYFRYGPSAVRCIELAMLAVGKRDLAEILDLPCGHGRVLRTLKAAFPMARLTACDIDRDAVDFCADTFAATPVYSSDRVQDIDLRNNFDLIWGGLSVHSLRSRSVGRFSAVSRVEIGGRRFAGLLDTWALDRRTIAFTASAVAAGPCAGRGDTVGL
jgi:SAM-dependent methyltransferase